MKRTNVGAGRDAAGFSFSATILEFERDCEGTTTEVVSRAPKALKLGARSAYMLGMKPIAVKAVASLGRCCVGKYLFHLKKTLDAHQKLATLSSNNPLAKGNIRWMDGMKWVGKDVRKGEKRTMKDMTVVAPMAIRCLVLQKHEFG